VDRAPYGSDTLSTHGLMRGGVLQLERWGLLDGLRAAGTPPIRRTVFHYGDETVAVSIRPTGGVDALYAPRRTVLDPLLADAAECAGARLEFTRSVTGLTRDDAGAVTGVVVTDRRRRTSRVERARLVVGADGRDSMVARAVGAPVTAAGRHAGEYLYGYWAGLAVDGYEWFYGDGLAGALIPTNDDLVCVFVAGSPARLQTDRSASTLARFSRLATRIGLADRLAGGTRVGPVRRVHALPPGYLRQPSGPGWALVGDAGHWLDPISTHGMTAGLRDADLLSAALLAGGPGLPGYQAQRDRLSLPMLELTDRIASFGWGLSDVRTLLRSMASAMADEVEALADLAPTA
jgi:2-polyprenyl-6-methoxyphenol hydroxylase-like FAD-dependent oxidoreductase